MLLERISNRAFVTANKLNFFYANWKFPYELFVNLTNQLIQKLIVKSQKLKVESQKLKDKSWKLKVESQKIKVENQKLEIESQRSRVETKIWNQKSKGEHKKLKIIM